ncbi:hypothetical protein [uncultured Mailhella sp.]|uniref:hypothetical protein n=1 Tax=uncultured Mailhella sp. TaxID=1981031 RepID=UPI0025CE17CD|nr:hypothetical protein [uncultured Mailhella sp.]
MAVSDYSTDPDLNTTISGINIAEGCPPSGINNAIRQLMADVKAESESQNETLSKTMTGATSSAAGKTGLVPAPAKGAQARPLRGDGTWATELTCNIKGNVTGNVTGDVTGSASENLPLSGGTMTGDIIGNKSDYFVRKTDKTGRLIFLSGPSGYADGASLYLSGNERSEDAGKFQLMASNDSVSNSLTGQTNGLLTWMGSSVIDASRVKTVSANSYRVKLPSGGTWMYFAVQANVNYDYTAVYTGTAAGGSYVTGTNNSTNYIKAICIRVD